MIVCCTGCQMGAHPHGESRCPDGLRQMSRRRIGVRGPASGPVMDLKKAAQALHTARRRLAMAMHDAEHAALIAIAEGATEVDVAKQLGVNRMTVRRWQGKL